VVHQQVYLQEQDLLVEVVVRVEVQIHQVPQTLVLLIEVVAVVELVVIHQMQQQEPVVQEWLF
jgi:hypothetical protein